MRKTAPSALCRNTLVLLASLSGLILLFNIRKCWPYTVDDAFITARYALHAAQGFGVVWNLADGPLEGFTHPAWFGLLTAAISDGRWLNGDSIS